MRRVERRYGLNEGYLAELYEQYQRNPRSVGPEVRKAFEAWAGRETGDAHGDGAYAAKNAQQLSRLWSLVHALRTEGHQVADIDPIGMRDRKGNSFESSAYGLSEDELAAIPSALVETPLAKGVRTADEVVKRLRATYCSALGYEFAHVDNSERRAWLYEAVESGAYALDLSVDDQKRLLRRLTQVEGFEQFLHRNYPGRKWFSIEGNDMLVPLLDELLSLASEGPVEAIGLGMAHRGRLNVLAHIFQKPLEDVLSEFEGGGYAGDNTAEDYHRGWMLDVKYHEGAVGVYEPPGEGEAAAVHIFLLPNPSHLELVNPVVLGAVRARHDQAVRDGHGQDPAMAVLVHGDASFTGQGIVQESLNLARLPGYSTGGTVHIIVNNQLGYTAEPEELQSSPYASGPARGFGMPIIHVNGDDPPAVLQAVRLAYAYRERFHDDVLIDLVGYRRYGHNEADEPAFTQPVLYERIREHPTVRTLWSQRLVESDVISAIEDQELNDEIRRQLQQTLDGVRGRQQNREWEYEPPQAPEEPEPEARYVTLDELRRLNEELHELPDGFALHPKLERPLSQRRDALNVEDEPGVNWAHAELLALGTALAEGVPVRLTGQDTERGTFSQRYAALRDIQTNQRLNLLSRLPSAQAPAALYNSPLSEQGALGFEYGYSVHARGSLVLWEAQFGDFINNAQSIVDEFIASAEAKWGQRSGVVLLLPHGYEGQGPNHSSAHLERFLQLAAEGNMRVVYPTTAAQYFHLLRRQTAVVRAAPDPLVVMTAKSLLRHSLAGSSPNELTQGGFHPVLENAPTSPDECQRVLLCSGKVAIDLASHGASSDGRVAVVRLEELFPFPSEELTKVLRRYQRVESFLWIQEEPRNYGAWEYVAPLVQPLLPGGAELGYVGRDRRPSSAEGLAALHKAEQKRIVEQAFEGIAETRPHVPPKRSQPAGAENGEVRRAG